MWRGKKVVAFIPARGGSKGIPNKNIIDLVGKPLISYSISASINSKYIDEVWVSSDSQDILNVAHEYGAFTIRRPDDISEDESPSEDALLHFSQNVEFDVVVFVQATSPLTEASDLDASIELLNKFDSVVAVTRLTQFVWNEDGPLYDLNNRKRRQDLKKTYLETGAFFLSTWDGFKETNNRLSGNIGMFEMPKVRSLDIDTYDDLELVKRVITSDIK